MKNKEKKKIATIRTKKKLIMRVLQKIIFVKKESIEINEISNINEEKKEEINISKNSINKENINEKVEEEKVEKDIEN